MYVYLVSRLRPGSAAVFVPPQADGRPRLQSVVVLAGPIAALVRAVRSRRGLHPGPLNPASFVVPYLEGVIIIEEERPTSQVDGAQRRPVSPFA
ncbi:hypothetical protein CCHR01_00607 [Colletotrichum chrysophilum]|uniref:Uncharacterized protein n=1 Tax=Colletotrichum chrysophilum TaxID=1836956 RepID=A0AAD9EM14_9PEZI|nr:hypothetical protein CCHR01_00607 [Colletotrichum chrysophilum]